MRCPKCGFEITPRRKQRASNMFHLLNTAYAKAQGLDPAVTKQEMKYWFGSWVEYPFPDDWTPEWPGQFVEMWEGTPSHTIVYLKSESAYDKTEENRLIDGAMQRCIEVGADLSFMENM